MMRQAADGLFASAALLYSLITDENTKGITVLRQVEKAKNKWGGIHEAIDALLHERQQLLVQYCQIAGLPPFEQSKTALPDKQAIKSFCEILMDYLSAGHFEVYEMISSQISDGTALLQTDEIFPKLQSSTDQALSFNDSYAEVSAQHDLAKFDVHLSNLGQSMEERFALEDRLIANLHAGQR